jgi:hypothetical protein
MWALGVGFRCWHQASPIAIGGTCIYLNDAIHPGH